MKRESPDPLSEAMDLLRNPAPGRGDIGELFLAELQNRRERLQNWLSLLDEQARLEDTRAPHQCRPRSAN